MFFGNDDKNNKTNEKTAETELIISNYINYLRDSWESHYTISIDGNLFNLTITIYI